MGDGRTAVFVGIDVQTKRGCALAAIDQRGRHLGSSWFRSVKEATLALRPFTVGRCHVGIDAPRCLLSRPRHWFWDGIKEEWRPRRRSERGYGRHCELVLAACGLANPQWTPLRGHAPDWMKLGVRLFEALDGLAETYEVFPSASYAQLRDDHQASVTLAFRGFAPGPKDMLDAYVAAVTVREFVAGRGCRVGGGDGLGEIVLPRPLKGTLRVTAWPHTRLIS